MRHQQKFVLPAVQTVYKARQKEWLSQAVAHSPFILGADGRYESGANRDKEDSYVVSFALRREVFCKVVFIMLFEHSIQI